MLKKIPVRQVRLGMHLHKLEGAWIHHPFWKTRFVIDSAEDLARLQGSGVAECWIDASLGLDAVPDAPLAAGYRAPLDAAAAPNPVPLPAEGLEPVLAVRSPAGRGARAPQARRSVADEMRQAAAVIDRGRIAVTAMFAEARMGRTVDSERCLPLVEEIADSVQRNAGALVSLARLKTHDDYSYMHSVAVCALMVALARGLGLDDAACRQAGAAGLMHDIGKALMPAEILGKPARLTEAEFTLIRTHPERGHALLLEGGSAGAVTLDVVLHHHERVDGQGYPQGLAGEAISQFARMGAICDVYDAITSNRPYKAGWDPAESISRMASWKGQFDGAIFGAFVQSLGIYPIGSLVRLASGRLAVVIEQNPEDLMTPVVKTFFSTKAQMPIPPTRLELARSSDRIVGREDPAGRFPHLDEIWAEPEALKPLRR